MKTSAELIEKTLFELSDAEKKAFLPYFFKTGPGQYGEGDKFIGVVIPKIRALVKTHKTLPLNEIEYLLDSKYHECRMTALMFLVNMYMKTKNAGEKEIYYQFYINHYKGINNWDLVDLSAPNIMGTHLLNEDKSLLYEWAQTDHLWKQRMAIISTFTFIRNERYADTFNIALLLMNHKHDLIHKAVGWMLREVGKRNFEAEYIFLTESQRYKTMPRTMLRYAIEKFPEDLRQAFLKGNVE